LGRSRDEIDERRKMLGTATSIAVPGSSSKTQARHRKNLGRIQYAKLG
jgi:hypothetical protein